MRPVKTETNVDTALLSELGRGKIAFLVGAGVSRPAPSRLLLGNELVSVMVDRLAIRARIKKTERIKLKRLVTSRLRPEVIFDVLFAEIGTSCFRPLRYLAGGIPNFLHYFLATMLELGNDVLTTNYDVQIERACGEMNVRFFKVVSRGAFQRAAISPPNGGTLYKLHGSLKVNGYLPERASLIAAMRQVGKGLEESKARVIDRILKEKQLIVIGYSGRDEFDIIPKLSGTKNVKGIHWFVHSSQKARPNSRRNSGGSTNDHIEQLLNKIDGPCRLVRGNTIDLIKRIWIPKITVRPSKTVKAGTKSTSRTLWSDLRQTTTLILIGDLLRKANAPKAADGAYRKILRINSDAVLEAKVTARRAQATLDLGNIDLALPMIERSLRLATTARDYSNIVTAYNYLGVIARKQSRWNDSIKFYRKALGVARQFGADPAIVQNIYNNLGIALEKMGDYHSALFYLKRGLKLARKSGDPESASKSLNNLGIAYDNLGKYEEAINSYRESLGLKEIIGYRHGMAQTSHNLGLVYEHSGNPDLAVFWYAKSLAIKRGVTHDKHGIAQTQSNLGRILRQKGKLGKARSLLHSAIAVLGRVGDDYGLAEASEELALVENALGNREKARAAARDAYSMYKKLRLSREAARCRRLQTKI